MAHYCLATRFNPTEHYVVPTCLSNLVFLCGTSSHAAANLEFLVCLEFSIPLYVCTHSILSLGGPLLISAAPKRVSRSWSSVNTLMKPSVILVPPSTSDKNQSPPSYCSFSVKIICHLVSALKHIYPCEGFFHPQIYKTPQDRN